MNRVLYFYFTLSETLYYIRLLENNGDRLYFLSCTKCGKTKEDCPHYFPPSGIPFNARRVPLNVP
jgi:hypothetical protein